MLEINSFEGKTKEETIEKAISSLEIAETEMFMFFNERETKLFKNKKMELLVLKNEDLIVYLKNHFNELSKLMEIDIKSEIKIREKIVNINLITSQNALIIGKNGQTLNALQHLLKQTLKNKTNFNIKINIDVSDYKGKKRKYLEYEIKNLCNEVIKTKMDIQLEPMNSYDRRIVHNIINNYQELESISSSEEPNRFITIKHK